MLQIEKTRIPFDAPSLDVTVISINKTYDQGDFGYLQAVRRGPTDKMGTPNAEAEYGVRYRAMLAVIPGRLANAVEPAIDAYLSPPSDHAYLTEPYRKAMRAKFPSAVDLTEFFIRNGDLRSAKDAPLVEVTAGLLFDGADVSQFRHVAIIDDILKRGVTAAAIIDRLRSNGLPADCAVTVVCPLWIIPKPSEQEAGDGASDRTEQS